MFLLLTPTCVSPAWQLRMLGHRLSTGHVVFLLDASSFQHIALWKEDFMLSYLQVAIRCASEMRHRKFQLNWISKLVDKLWPCSLHVNKTLKTACRMNETSSCNHMLFTWFGASVAKTKNTRLVRILLWFFSSAEHSMGPRILCPVWKQTLRQQRL